MSLTDREFMRKSVDSWKVAFDGNFLGSKGRAGKEMPIRREFEWEGQRWYIPALYLCGKGIVADFCVPVELEKVQKFYDKWMSYLEGLWDEEPGESIRNQIEEENPLSLHFTPRLVLGGREMPFRSGCSVCWTPAFSQGRLSEQEAQWVAEHYGLDSQYAWSIHRFSFPWATKRRPVIRSLSLILEQDPVERATKAFEALPGNVISLRHPFSGEEYLLTVRDCQPEEISFPALRNGFEFPRHCNALRYTLEPELPKGKFRLRDCAQNDPPVLISSEEKGAASIGIIGGVDGPTAIFVAHNQGEVLERTDYSALHFRPVPPQEIKWQAVFREKTKADITVDLTADVTALEGETQ